MFNRLWPKPPEADGDLQTDDDAARPEKYHRNWIAIVHKDEEDEEVEEDDNDDHDEEWEKLQSPHGVRYSTAPPLPHFMARYVYIL